MKNNEFLFWQRWLLVIGIIIIIFGLGLTFLSGTILFALFDRQINPIFWGTIAVTGEVRQFQQWIYGVLGATMAGWGVFLAFIAHYPFKAQERWAWNCLTYGLLLWFGVDTAISLYHGVVFNAVFNVILLGLVGPPLLASKKYF